MVVDEVFEVGEKDHSISTKGSHCPQDFDTFFVLDTPSTAFRTEQITVAAGAQGAWAAVFAAGESAPDVAVQGARSYAATSLRDFDATRDPSLDCLEVDPRRSERFDVESASTRSRRCDWRRSIVAPSTRPSPLPWRRS